MRRPISNPNVTYRNLSIAFLALVVCVVITLLAFQPKATIAEDDPRWECATMGNKVCGDPEGKRKTEAWATWDQMNGWQRLKVDPSREVRVDYVGTATLSPNVASNEVALPAQDGLWYVFRATQ